MTSDTLVCSGLVAVRDADHRSAHCQEKRKGKGKLKAKGKCTEERGEKKKRGEMDRREEKKGREDCSFGFRPGVVTVDIYLEQTGSAARNAATLNKTSATARRKKESAGEHIRERESVCSNWLQRFCFCLKTDQATMIK